MPAAAGPPARAALKQAAIHETMAGGAGRKSVVRSNPATR
jgi:hypothetical protein